MLGRGEVKENINSSNWHSHLSQLPWNEKPTYKRKEWEKKYYNVHGCIYIPQNTHLNHTSCVIRARGAKCRGPFFQSTVDRVQHLSDLLGVQSPTSPVIHGRQNMKRNGPKAIHQAQAPKKLTEAQPICSPNSSLPHKKNLEIIRKRGGKWLSHKHHFSLISWHGARGTEGRHFQGIIWFPKPNNYDQELVLFISHQV